VASLPTPVARAIFLTTQEALANIARHARATQVVLKARRAGNAVELLVVDNGRGFDTDIQNQTIGHGLSNMRARAEELHGSCVIWSEPGQGTRIELSLPGS
jgi:signal transduction histidine kinase